MARIAGVDLPNKHVHVSLTYIYGIGRSSADAICKRANVDPTKMMNDLSTDEVNELRKLIESEYKVEGRLRSEIGLNIKRLMFKPISERRRPSTLYSDSISLRSSLTSSKDKSFIILFGSTFALLQIVSADERPIP